MDKIISDYEATRFSVTVDDIDMRRSDSDACRATCYRSFCCLRQETFPLNIKNHTSRKVICNQ